MQRVAELGSGVVGAVLAAAARAEVRAILGRFGWEAEDPGAVEAARAIEPLCVLWCIPGFQGWGWSHAPRMLRGT